VSTAGHARPLAADPGATPLLERAAELEALGGAMRRVTGGHGAIVMLEAPAGLGKTVLLDHAGTLAEEAELELRRAAPGPLERHFPYGLVRALLEAPVRALSPRELARLEAGPAAEAVRLLRDGGVPEREAAPQIAHSLFWLCSALAAARPLALIVDDAQWADRQSLVVLSYVARRIEELPLLMVVGARGDDPRAPSDLLSLLGSARGATRLRPQPLTAWGAVALIRRHAPDASLRSCLECHRAVDGSPWLLDELGRQIARFGPLPEGRGAPPVTTDARDIVRRRLAALPPPDRAVAAALAILGNCAPLHVVAELAGVPIGELAPIRDALQAAGLLAPDGLRFVHGLVAAALVEDLTHTDRERLHRMAARLLAATDTCADASAAHLLECSPQGDPAVTAQLVRAAAEARLTGTPLVAASYLERALEERAPGDDRGRLLADLGAAMFDAGRPGAAQRLRASLREPHDEESRIEVITRLAGLEVLAGRSADIIDLLREHEGLGSEVATLDALAPLPGRQVERQERLEALDRRAIGDREIARAVVAHKAWLATELGGLPAVSAAELAADALRDGVLLDATPNRAAYLLALRTLVLADHQREARAAIDALRDAAELRGSLPLRAIAAWHAGELALRCGQVAEAEREGRAALALAGDALRPVSRGALEVLVRALAERGAFDEAEAVMLRHGLDAPSFARARLLLATSEYAAAHAEACAAGARAEARGRLNPSWVPWRSTAAIALAHLGRRDEAAALADEEVARAQQFGAPIPLAGALHARAVAEPDDRARIEICLRALRAVDGVAAVLDTVRIRLELGSTLLRTGSRVQAREALRPALADADAVGAVPLAKRARRELVATGLRPRRAAIEGAASLTPRQRQICSLAAAGRANREIARALFLSVKTVETHLAAGYRKLGISSRAELSGALGA
jgi:DNA-binding CsgD family transcriptional regulator